MTPHQDFLQVDFATTARDHRNKRGQYPTPAPLAKEMAGFALNSLPSDVPVRFLEPGFGRGAFYDAISQLIPEPRLVTAWGYEVDHSVAVYAHQRWRNHSLMLMLEDFTTASPPIELETKFNVLLCNPPYVRHHYLDADRKKELQEKVYNETKVSLNGRAGLYCYFLLLAHKWLAPNAIAGWLLPGEFLDANYGAPAREYLASRVTLLRIHRFETTESLFEDAEVSSTLVFFQNAAPGENHETSFSLGGSLSAPKLLTSIPISKLRMASKWSNLVEDDSHTHPRIHIPDRGRHIQMSDAFRIMRGIATGANDFFVLKKEQAIELELPDVFLRPVLPSARYLRTDRIDADEFGNPIAIPSLYLVDCSLNEDEVYTLYPRLWDYFEVGKKFGIHQRTLCRNRKVWYFQESRTPSPVVCKYMGNHSGSRNKVFRFFWNKSRAIVTNAYYMLYPGSELQRFIDSGRIDLDTIVQSLNAFATDAMFLNGRKYGGGKVKIEPRELSGVSADFLVEMLTDYEDARK